MKKILVLLVCGFLMLGLFSSCEIDGGDNTEYMVFNDEKTYNKLTLHEYDKNGVEVKTESLSAGREETFLADPAARKILVYCHYTNDYDYSYGRWLNCVYQLRRGERIIIKVPGAEEWVDKKPKIK